MPGTIKLASNEVAAPPPARVLAAIAEAATGGNRYPDMAVSALRERLAARHEVADEQVAVGCGSVSLCQQVIQLSCSGPADEVLYAWRSFEAYPIITHVVGATGRVAPLDGEHRHDLDAMTRAVTGRTRVVFICNPNNPTGTAVGRTELKRFLAAVPPEVIVVLDEAYREFVTDPGVPDGMTLLAEQPNLVVLRTFSKAYRLAGLRVGYAVAAPALIEAVQKVGVPFAVNALAQAAAAAALDSESELLATCRTVVAERGRVRGELLASGFTVPDSQGNFVWLPIGRDATAFAGHCAAHKVIVRPFAGDGVRVTVSDRPEDNDAFLAAARLFRGEEGVLTR